MTLLVCIDCAAISANGTEGHCEDCHDDMVCETRMRTLRGMTRTLGDDAAGLVVGEDVGFCHSSCQGCGSVLSGDRFEAMVL